MNRNFFVDNCENIFAISTSRKVDTGVALDMFIADLKTEKQNYTRNIISQTKFNALANTWKKMSSGDILAARTEYNKKTFNTLEKRKPTAEKSR